MEPLHNGESTILALLFEPWRSSFVCVHVLSASAEHGNGGTHSRPITNPNKEMKTAALVLGIIGNVLSFLVLAAPIPTCWRIFKRGSIESFSAFPYVCTLLSNMMWLYYGILDSKGIFLISIGTAGCALEALYLSMYMLYAPTQERLVLVRQLLVAISIYSIMLIFSMTFSFGGTRLEVVGFLCALISVCMYASPLIVMKVVIITRSVEYMPFLLSLSLFLCGGVWFFYGVLMKDLYLEISNGSGFFLGFLQLILYAFYNNFTSRLVPSNGGKGQNFIHRKNKSSIESTYEDGHHPHSQETENEIEVPSILAASVQKGRV